MSKPKPTSLADRVADLFIEMAHREDDGLGQKPEDFEATHFEAYMRPVYEAGITEGYRRALKILKGES